MKITREKERHILKLLRGGWGWTDICEEVGCGPNTISKIKKKNEERKVRRIKSFRSEAFKKFESKKKPTNLDVAIELDLPSDEIISYKMEYCKLKRFDKFEDMYYEYKDSLPFIVDKYQELKELNISADQLVKTISLVTRLPALQAEIQSLCQNRDNLWLDYSERQKEYREIEAYVSSMKSECRRIRTTLRLLRRMINKDGKEAHGMVNSVLNEIMEDRSKFLWLALLAIVRAMSELPPESVFRNLSYLNTFLNTYIVRKDNYAENSEIITYARRLYDLYCQEIVKETIHYTSPVAINNGLNTRVDNVAG